MVKYIGEKDYEHGSKEKIGVLITNLGTPDAPEKKELKIYLNQFLSDPRVIELPRILWQILLKLVILQIRPSRSAAAYKKVWTEKGSPLLVIANNQLNKIKSSFLNANESIVFEIGMRYGNPSIESALEKFKTNNILKILVLPLYPQAGSPTNSSTLDELSSVFSRWPWVPNLRFINGYHDREDYILALCNTIESSVDGKEEIEKIIFSFHGMPFRYLKDGDPYYCFCHKTARLVKEKLQLEDHQHCLAFQSRFGREEWLKPYIDDEIVKFANEGVKRLHIISPGFSVDCLETLEEIKIGYSELFEENGGDELVYIPCLNNSEEHIKLIKNILDDNLDGWLS